ncbi:MAG: asparagine--tRNA ligase [Candidatus Heimdallarchaeota archaeon]|nr:asparagine--tRNA ligase [Candidatus Heimdallarchaeota archaeon]MCG3257584.1 asparagine--tRNA ligase [Candidatus Heimdallarchaeota archaeon]MCK4612636.1 asparagine--tRNA ligase [Candidatus Heimdallarchaeota archaeon]
MPKQTFIYASKVTPSEDTIKLRGWVYRIRKMKDKIFVILRDASGIIQCIGSENQLTSEAWNMLNEAAIENYVTVEGKPVEDNRAVNNVEVKLTNFTIMHKGEIFPIAKDQSKEFMLDNTHLFVRSYKATNVWKVKASVLRAAREWFFENGFYETTPPILTGSACEGGSTLFSLKYFDHTAYLSQSIQLYLEALIYSLEKVYAITPSFRAEKMRTKRHVNEFWHIEGEEAFVDFEGNMKIQEELVAYIVQYVLKHNAKEFKELKRDTSVLETIKAPFKKISYKEAIDTLNENGFNLKWDEDMKTEEERALSTIIAEPFFVRDYPSSHKPFYVKLHEDNPKWCYSADLMAPEGFGELITGGQREDVLDTLIRRIKEEGWGVEDYAWYIDLRKYGSVPHSGFGLGAERLTWWLCGLEAIQETLPFPRTRNRVYP